MIVVDTSALMAIILAEPIAHACMVALRDADEIVISAGTLAECFIVAGRRDKAVEMAELIGGLAPRIEPVSAATARRVADAYDRWGRGIHSAGLNFGDCSDVLCQLWMQAIWLSATRGLEFSTGDDRARAGTRR